MAAILTQAAALGNVEGNYSTARPTPLEPPIPRVLSPEVDALLRRSIKQIVTQNGLSLPPSCTLNNHSRRGPLCTHIAMIRLYGDHVCMLCGHVPELGFVYLCEQDHIQEIRGRIPSIDALPLVADHGNFFEAQAATARSIGMNDSVVRQMRAGEYTHGQIETLLDQRRKVKEVIKQAEHSLPSPKKLRTTERTLMGKLKASWRSDHAKATGKLPPTSPAAQAAQHAQAQPVADAPTTQMLATTSETPSHGHPKTKCNFKVCHTCRPFFQHRVPESLGAMLNDELPPLTPEDAAILPVRDSTIIRRLGLRDSVSAGKRRDSHAVVGNGAEKWDLYDATQSSNASAASFESDSKSTELIETDDTDPCPGMLICPLYTPEAGCAYEQGFDDGNRVLNHSLAPLVTNDYHGLAVDMADDQHNSLLNSLNASPSTASLHSLPDRIAEPPTPSKARATSSMDFAYIEEQSPMLHNPQSAIYSALSCMTRYNHSSTECKRGVEGV